MPLQPTRGLASLLPILRMREMWATLAIGVMWLAVLFDGIYGPNIENGGPTGSSTPSVIVVAVCAMVATIVIGRAAFKGDRDSAG
jgi:hypothetical protein